MTKKYEEQRECKTQETDNCTDMPVKFLSLADEALNELLKEKIKAEIEKICGDSIDKLVNLITETHKTKWLREIQGKFESEEDKKNLAALFAEDCE